MPAAKNTAAGGTATTGTSGSGAATSTDVGGKEHTITLTAEGTADLASHVGHEVSVTGRMPKKDNRHIAEGAGVDQQSSGGAVNAGGQPSGMTTMTSGQGIGGGDVRALRVSSITMISSSCSAKH